MSVLLRKKYESIKKEKLSDSGKALLKSMAAATNNFKDAKASAKIKTKFLAFFDKLKTSKPEAIKGLTAPKEPSNAKQFKEARERRSGQSGVPQKESDIEKDAGRPAISVKGKRVTDGKHYPYVKGNVYYEYRDNRYDKRPKKYPKLEDGGMMADGGMITKENLNVGDTIQAKGENWGTFRVKSLYNQNPHIWVIEGRGGSRNLGEGELKFWEFSNKMADGGIYDRTDFEINEKVYISSLKKNGKVVDVITEKGIPMLSIKIDNGETLKLPYSAIQKVQMAMGGYMADGGEMAMGGEPHRIDEIFAEGGTIAQGNNEMLESQLKAVEHHVKELSSILTKDTEVEAWVVGKIERAATDLSDITHYLDGRKFEDGGSVDSSKFYVAVSETNDGYWVVMSRPTHEKWVAESMIENVPRNEVGKVVTLDEARKHTKIIGKEYLTDDMIAHPNKFADGGMMAKGGFVSKGELVWRKLNNSKKSQFLKENFTPQITPRSQEILVGKDFQFLPKDVKIKLESKYANVEEYRYGGTMADDGMMAKGGEIGKKYAIIYFKDKKPIKKRYDSSFKAFSDHENEGVTYVELFDGRGVRLSSYPKKMAKGGKLIGKQKNIDVNKNGKLDAEDFKLLRQKAKSRLKK